MVVTLVRDAATAVLERLAAFGAAQGLAPWNWYAGGRVPPYPTNGTSLEKRNYYPYGVVFSGQRTDTSLRRISDSSTTRPFRVVTQFVGTTAGEAMWLEDYADAALRGHVFEIDGVVCTPTHHEAEQLVGKDPDFEDLFTGTAGWTFVATVQD